MPIYHSKTWPTSAAMAVVQLRVDQQGKAFSAIANRNQEQVRNKTNTLPPTRKQFNGKAVTETTVDIVKVHSDTKDHCEFQKKTTKRETPTVNISNTKYVFPPTTNSCTYDCIRSERETDFKRCNCQFTNKTSTSNNATTNGLVCKYSEDNLKFIQDAKQYFRRRMKEENRNDKRKKAHFRSSDSNMTVSTILRSNSCDSNFIYNFNKLKTLRKSFDRSTDSLEFSSKSNIFNSKICYCIQLLALSPDSLLRSIQFPSKTMDRRCSNSSASSVCKWTPKHANRKSDTFSKKGRSKSVSHMVIDKSVTGQKPTFRRCNSTIEAVNRRQSEVDEKDLTNGSVNIPKTPLSARKTQTLYRHYYPEGGWGWTILVVCVVVSVLDHGMQLAAAILVRPAVDKFKVPAVHAAVSGRNYLLMSPKKNIVNQSKSTITGFHPPKMQISAENEQTIEMDA